MKLYHYFEEEKGPIRYIEAQIWSDDTINKVMEEHVWMKREMPG